MQDILFIAGTLAFFGVCVAYIRGLDRLVRATEATEVEIHPDVDLEELAA
jgi:hypothetical protein